MLIRPLLIAALTLAVRAARNETLTEHDARITYTDSLQWSDLRNASFLGGSITHSAVPEASLSVAFEVRRVCARAPL